MPYAAMKYLSSASAHNHVNDLFVNTPFVFAGLNAALWFL